MKPTIKRRTRVSPCKAAYDFWVSNPSYNAVSVAEKFKVSADNLNAWVRSHKKTRPDGYVAPILLGQKSPKKIILKKVYDLAVKNNETCNWAASQATKLYGIKVAKNEVQYWAMKNNLPYLDELQMGVKIKIT